MGTPLAVTLVPWLVIANWNRTRGSPSCLSKISSLLPVPPMEVRRCRCAIGLRWPSRGESPARFAKRAATVPQRREHSGLDGERCTRKWTSSAWFRRGASLVKVGSRQRPTRVRVLPSRLAHGVVGTAPPSCLRTEQSALIFGRADEARAQSRAVLCTRNVICADVCTV